MFKCFNKANRPKSDDDPKKLEDVFATPSTANYLGNANTPAEGSNNQIEDPTGKPLNTQPNTNNTQHSQDHNGNRGSSSLAPPHRASTHNGFTTTCSTYGTDTKPVAAAAQPTPTLARDEALTSKQQRMFNWTPSVRKTSAATVTAAPESPTVSLVSGPAHLLKALEEREKMDRAVAERERADREKAATVATNINATASLSTDSGTHTAGGSLASPPRHCSAFSPAPSGAIFAPRPVTSTATFVFGGGAGADKKEYGSSQPTTVSTPTSAHRDDFGGFRGNSAAEPHFTPQRSPQEAAAAAGVARMFRSALSESVRATSSAPSVPSSPAPSTTTILTPAPSTLMTSMAKKQFEVVVGDSVKPDKEPPFTGFGTTVTPAGSAFTGFGTTKSTTVPPAGSAFGTMQSPTVAPAGGSGSTGFGTTTNSAPAAPMGSAFGGFGTMSSPTVAPASSGFPCFGTMKSTTVPPAGSAFGTMKSPSEAAASSSFTGFRTINNSIASPPAATVAPVTVAETEQNDFAGFGTATLPAEKTTLELRNGLAGFGLGTVTLSPPAPAATTIAPPPAAAAETAHSSASMEQVQRDFGTLHVSGPAHLMKALAEREKMDRAVAERERADREKAAREREEREKEEEAERSKRRVHFEQTAVKVEDVKVEVHEEKEVRQVKEELQEEAPVSAEDTEGTDDDAPTPRFPWGKRPSFREMLEGGNKKLVLISPPPPVSRYFADQVFRSYGCTYDNVDNTFYATSPGTRGGRNGQVVSLDGNTSRLPICVTSDLVEPAAIAVFEPGLAVCVVTNRGIFVFTKHTTEQGREAYLSRQISTKGFHRGIAVTANRCVVSFNNGFIRLFDGNVDNGQERVLAEANYDQVINRTLFADRPNRRMEKSNCCFLDIVNNRLVMSDLQKHVISLWDIEETDKGCAFHFVRAIDVAVCENPKQGNKQGLRASQIPLGKCSYASGIRLDAEGWVICADADGRTIQIFDDQLNFVTRIETHEQLPYISGLYIESNGHLMLCDRRSEMGGLRVYMVESVEAGSKPQPPQQQPAVGQKKPLGFAAAARQQQQGAGSGRFY